MFEKGPKTQRSDSENELMSEIAKWILSVLFALITYILLAKVVIAIYHPDVAALKAEAYKLVVVPELAFPKPVESMLFRLAFAIIIPALYFFYTFLSRKKTDNSFYTSKAIPFPIRCKHSSDRWFGIC